MQTVDEIRTAISTFLEGGGGEWDWDDFISTPRNNAYLDAIRVVCRDIPTMFPPEPGSRMFCNEAGWRALEAVRDRLLPQN
jgi:hypothetical protein